MDGRAGRRSPRSRRSCARAGSGGRRDAGRAACRRAAAGHLLGPGRRAPAAVRRLAGRTRPDLGRAARPRPSLDPGARPARPARPTSAATTAPTRGTVRPDGHLRPEWTGGGWQRTPARLAAWAALAVAGADLQARRLAALGSPATRWPPPGRSRPPNCCAPSCPSTACRSTARRPSSSSRPSSDRGRPMPTKRAQRERRDDAVLRLAPAGVEADLRNPAPGQGAAGPVGIDVPDTRSWRLEPFGGAHPVVEALLSWRKAERIATTYGYAGWTSGRAGRPAARGLVGQRRRGRPDDRAGRAAQPAGRAAAGGGGRSGLGVRPGRPRPDRAPDAGRGVGRSRPSPGPRPRTTCTPRWPPGSGRAPGGQGRRAGRDVRPDLGRGRAGAARARGRPTRSRCATCATPTTPDGPGATSAPTAAGWCGCGRSAPAWTSRAARGGRRPRPLRPQRGRAGRGGRALQGLGGHGAGARRGSGARMVLCLHDELLVHAPATPARRTALLRMPGRDGGAGPRGRRAVRRRRSDRRALVGGEGLSGADSRSAAG